MGDARDRCCVVSGGTFRLAGLADSSVVPHPTAPAMIPPPLVTATAPALHLERRTVAPGTQRVRAVTSSGLVIESILPAAWAAHPVTEAYFHAYITQMEELMASGALDVGDLDVAPAPLPLHLVRG